MAKINHNISEFLRDQVLKAFEKHKDTLVFFNQRAEEWQVLRIEATEIPTIYTQRTIPMVTLYFSSIKEDHYKSFNPIVYLQDKIDLYQLQEESISSGEYYSPSESVIKQKTKVKGNTTLLYADYMVFLHDFYQVIDRSCKMLGVDPANIRDFKISIPYRIIRTRNSKDFVWIYDDTDGLRISPPVHVWGWREIKEDSN